MRNCRAPLNGLEANNSRRFLLARFNVDYISGFKTVGGIEKALLNLSIPESTGSANDNTPSPSERENERRMDDVYNRIVDSIRNLPQAINRKYAFRALSWIGYATRTLNARELLVAICVEPGQYQLNDKDMHTLEDLLDICNGLVVVDDSERVADDSEKAVRLIHFSVRNYLDRNKVIPEDTRETYRAITCSTYLSFDIIKEQHWPPWRRRDLIRHLPFLYYAANNLAFHLSMVEYGHYPETTSAILKILEDKEHRHAYCNINGGFLRRLEIPRLNLACAIGYEDAVRTLLKEDGVDVNARDTEYGRTPLIWAAGMGHEAVVMQLLDNRDVKVNAKDTNTSLTPLSWAVLRRNEAVVRHLLSEGRVDQNCKDRKGRTPLSFEIQAGDKNRRILQLLLEKGVEVNFTYSVVSQFDLDKTRWYWRC